jgi:L-rhamnose-H+ transport protein
MIGQGIGIIVLAGILGGSVLAPIKWMRRWRFEKSWAIYSVWAYLIMPWVMALLTVPHLFSIYQQVSFRTMLICGLCGIGWGTAVVLYGVAVNMIGLSLTTAILYGASIAVGSLAPLLISNRAALFSRQGFGITLADVGIIVGVVFCAWAGKMRKGAGMTEEAAASSLDESPHFLAGVIAALLGAFLSSLLNLALAYGGEFNRLALARGASPLNAANAQWAFTVTFGYLPNLLLSIVTFSRRKEWKSLLTGPVSYWIWSPIMGLMFIGGTVLYGTGAGFLKSMGPVLGWPIYMSMSIVGGVFWGYAGGEWKAAPRRALQYLGQGVLIQLLFIVLLGLLGK